MNEYVDGQIDIKPKNLPDKRQTDIGNQYIKPIDRGSKQPLQAKDILSDLRSEGEEVLQPFKVSCVFALHLFCFDQYHAT